MGETLDQVLAGVQRDISNPKADTTSLKLEISNLNSNRNGMTKEVSNLDNNISKIMMPIETLLQTQVNVQSPILKDDSLISGAKKKIIQTNKKN
ncbi:hypothetical protein K3495_g11490 [Podosphaera aphanis]|nr:hypothetical protein K3495_g11490 [Podosphaera aphanis]